MQCCALHEVLGVPSGITLVLLEVLSLLHLTSITSLLEFYYLSSTAGMTCITSGVSGTGSKVEYETMQQARGIGSHAVT